MERSVKLSKPAELPVWGGVMITLVAGAALWTSLLYVVYLLF
nr:hypothetical protein [uncultured Dyadobacter sp.]